VHHALRIIFLFQQSVFIRVHPWFKLFLLMFFPGSFLHIRHGRPHHLPKLRNPNLTPRTLYLEGCSSCPPAESRLKSRLKESPGLWKRLRSSWPSTWIIGTTSLARPLVIENLHRPSARLRRAWRSDSVYTPGFVLNGRNGVIGRDQRTGQNPMASRQACSPSVLQTRIVGR